MAIGQAGQVEIAIKILDRATKELNSISKSAKNLGRQTKQLGKSLTRNVTLPLLAVGIASIKMASDLDKSMRNIQSITGQTDAEIAALSKEILDLSTDMNTGAFSAKEYADALYNVNSAGFEGEDAMHILRVSSRAATAGLADLGTAADVTLGILKTYNLAASEAERVNDLLFTTVKFGKITFQDLASSMSRVLPIANSLGIGLADVTAAFTTLSNQSIDAAESATVIRATMKSIVQPTEAMAMAIRVMGFASGEALIRQEGLNGALNLLNQYASDSGISMRSLSNDVRAQTGLVTLAGDQMENFNINLQHMGESSGAMSAAFTEQAKSFEFNFNKMVASIQKVLVIIGEELIPIIQPMIDSIRQAAEDFSNLDEATKKNIVRFGVFVAIVGPLVVIVGTLISAIGTIAGVFAAGGVAATVAAGGVSILNIAFALLAANPIVAAIVAIGVAIGVLMLLFPGFRKAVMDIFKGIGDAVSGAVNMVKSLFSQAVTITKAILGYDIGKATGENFGAGVAVGMVETTGQGVQAVAKQIGSLTDLSRKAAAQIDANLSNATAPAAAALGTQQQVQFAKGTVRFMSIATGDPNAGFQGADIQAMADAIKQQLISGLGLGGVTGLGGIQTGVSFLEQFQNVISSPDFSQADKNQLLTALGGAAGGEIGGGGINITIENLYAPGFPEELIETVVTEIANKLKLRNLSGTSVG